MSDPYIGMEIAGQFRVQSRLGSGGMGAVYKAEQPDMHRYVAVKILHPRYVARSDIVSRFRREARAMSHLSHPNTARVFMCGELPSGACYFVMEYLDGRTLAQAVRVDGPMAPERALRIMIQVCGAVEEAHREGIVHRDLKPENIFLTNQGGISDFPKVLDFGLAKVTQREMRPGSLILTQEGMVFGTPEFMSPEQARGQTLDARTDIYSLGVILYELLTGKLPFDAKQPMQYLQHHIESQPIALSSRVPGVTFHPKLDLAIAKALEKDRDNRYGSAADFATELGACIDAMNSGVRSSDPMLYAVPKKSDPPSAGGTSSNDAPVPKGPAPSRRSASSASAPVGWLVAIVAGVLVVTGALVWAALNLSPG